MAGMNIIEAARHGRVCEKSARPRSNRRLGVVQQRGSNLGRTCLFTLAATLLLVGFGEVASRLVVYLLDQAALNPLGESADLTALNYNDTAVPIRKTPGEFRILTFGDSYVYGTVKTDSTFESVAAGALGQAGAKARLVNLGEPATSFFQYRKAVAHWTGRIETDAVLVGMFLGNDCAEVAWNAVPDDLPVNGRLREAYVEIATNRKRFAAAPRTYGLRLLDYAAAAVDIKTAGKYVVSDIAEPFNSLFCPMPEQQFREQLLNQAAAGEGERCGELARGWKALADLGRDLSRLGRERGVRAAVVLEPAEAAVNPGLWRETAAQAGVDPGRFDPSLPGRMARAVLAAAAPDVAVLDLTPIMACAAARGDRLYPAREIHWNAAGNRLAGQAIARFAGRIWLGKTADAFVGLDPCLDAAPLPDGGGADVVACLGAAGPFGPAN